MAKKIAQSEEPPEGRFPQSVCDVFKPDYTGPTVFGSIDMTTDEGRKAYLNTVSDPDFRAEEMNGEKFGLVHWLVSLARFDAKEGEDERVGLRIVFIDDQNRTLSTTSEAVGRWLDSVFVVYGRGPYDPPISMSLFPATSRAGRRTYKVRVY